MSIFRKASADTVRLDIGDQGDWLEVRTEISKRDFNRFIKYMPNRQVSEDSPLVPAEAVELQMGLFEALVVRWSGDPEEPTVDDYLALDQESASLVDEALAKHFETLSPSKEEAKTGFRPRKAQR